MTFEWYFKFVSFIFNKVNLCLNVCVHGKFYDHLLIWFKSRETKITAMPEHDTEESDRLSGLKIYPELRYTETVYPFEAIRWFYGLGLNRSITLYELFLFYQNPYSVKFNHWCTQGADFQMYVRPHCSRYQLEKYTNVPKTTIFSILE